MLSKRMVWITAAMVVIGAACGSTSKDDSWSAEALGRAASASDLSPTVANSGGTLAVGENRLAIAFFDENGGMLHDIDGAALQLFVLDDADGGTLVDEAVLRRSQLLDEDHDQSNASPGVSAALVADIARMAVDARRPSHDDPLATLYVANVSFDRSGWWGAELAADRGDERHEGLRIRFFVSEQSELPMIGDLVPRTEQKVLRDVSDFSEIDTSRNTNPAMHTQTVVEALDSGVPVVIGITTPLFCQTRFCGPVLEQALRPLLGRYVHDVVVLHIEPFELEQARAGEPHPDPDDG
jgi:hypothetical protein